MTVNIFQQASSVVVVDLPVVSYSVAARHRDLPSAKNQNGVRKTKLQSRAFVSAAVGLPKAAPVLTYY
jgi:hypothetical protein